MAVTKAQWEQARKLWEADADMSLADIAAQLGVSRPAVTQHAQRNNWRKVNRPIQREELAQAAADVLSSISGRTELMAEVSTVLDLSIESRVRILNLHRGEWAKWREQFSVEAMASDPTCARRAKLAAESLAVAQRGEAIAFGMTTFSGQDTDAPVIEDVQAEAPKSKLDLALEYYLEHGTFPDTILLPPPMQTPRMARPGTDEYWK